MSRREDDSQSQLTGRQSTASARDMPCQSPGSLQWPDDDTHAVVCVSPTAGSTDSAGQPPTPWSGRCLLTWGKFVCFFYCNNNTNSIVVWHSIIIPRVTMPACFFRCHSKKNSQYYTILSSHSSAPHNMHMIGKYPHISVISIICSDR
jgi:hypothetical protein